MGVLHRLSVCGGKDPGGLVASGQEATLGIWKIPELSSGLSKSFCYSSVSVSPLALGIGNHGIVGSPRPLKNGVGCSGIPVAFLGFLGT